MLLTADELHQVTGRWQAPKQIAWLRRNRWRFVVDADGKPKVDRGYYERRMRDDEAPDQAEPQPYFEALNEPLARKRSAR